MVIAYIEYFIALAVIVILLFSAVAVASSFLAGPAVGRETVSSR